MGGAERGIYQQNRWAASRFGPRATMIHPEREGAASVEELADELRGRGVELDASSCEADRQLELGRADGLQAVCADLVVRSVA